MRVALADAEGPPPLPVRTFEHDRDEAAVHALVEEAMGELEGHVAAPLEVWLAQRMEKAGWDAALGCVREDDDGPLGVALGERWDGGVGYVAQLAVAPRARGHGHGRALLLALFAAFRRDGLRSRRALGARRQPRRGRSLRVRGHARVLGGRAMGEGPWPQLTPPAWPSSPARRDGSGSTRSSCPRAATARCCASCRCPWAARSWCSTRSRRSPASRPRRSPRSSPTRPSRSSSTPGARTSRSCAAQWRTSFTNVFDTQIAAGFAGFSAQAGYTGLLHDVLRIRLAKTRELHALGRPAAHRRAAALRARDVEHLLPLADELRARLEARGRLEWAREECRAIAEATDERDPLEVWRRLPRVVGPRPARARGGARARGLARARRPRARTARSARSCATRRWSSSPSASRAGRRDLAQIRGVSPDIVRRRGDDILAAIERGRAAPPIQLDDGERLLTEAADGPVIALAEALVRARAQEAGLAYELIAARADLAPIVVAARRGLAEPDVRTLRGWRRQLVGAELLELLAGRRTLAVDGDGRVQVSEG